MSRGTSLFRTKNTRVTCLLQVCALAACLLLVPTIWAQDYASTVVSRHVLTNEAVITLAKAGFDELFIVERIRTTRVHFDTSVEGLVNLKQAGLSEDVIRLITQRDNQDYKRETRLSYYAPPAVTDAGPQAFLPATETAPRAPPPPAVPTVTEKRWWVFRWIRVSY